MTRASRGGRARGAAAAFDPRALWLAACAASCAPAEEPADAVGGAPAEARPDLVLVVIDTLRRDHVGLFGYGQDTAPFLAELAARGAVFERAHSTSSWTAPATASVFTGLYPNEHGVVEGFRVQSSAQESAPESIELVTLPEDWPTLPETLAAAGYATFGVAANINVGGELGFARGFDRFEHVHRARAEEVVATVLSWRAELERQRPYFLYLHFNDTHKPYDGRPEFGYRPMDERLADIVAAYDSEIRYVDHWLGELFREMAWAPEGARPAVAMLVSDHGEEFLDHGQLGHRFTLHAEVNDVVMLLLASGVRGGTRVQAPASLVDVAPTLLEAAGIAPPAGASGRSLLALAREPERPAAERALFAHRVPGARDEQAGSRAPLWAVIDGPWKLVQEEGVEGSLFDRASDPHEARDVAAERPEVAERLRAELEGFRRSAEPRARQRVEVPLDQELLRELEALGYAGVD